jgi:spore maturation protein CgeB
VRLFEAAACGTPIISDRWPGLTALLPENEAILIADDTQAVIDALLGQTEAARQRMAAAARAIVLRNHTGYVRARELQRYLAEMPGVPTQALAATETG